MQTSTEQPQQVCLSCKNRKRKCDKALPKCASCSKRNLSCEYPGPDQKRPPASATWSSVTHPSSHTINFPTILFLDPSILQHGQVEIPTLTASVPVHIIHLLGDMNEVRNTALQFFQQIHLWMPFISKKRFHDVYLRPSFHSQPDITLLLLSIKLITTLPPTHPRNPRTDLYHATKHFYLELEISGILSVPILQAGVLIALYELGHAIYPAASLSIGACARYAQVLGINATGSLKKKVLTLIEAEERRRLWWAIIILDRFASIGCPERPFTAADPTLDDLLPVGDAAWDQGNIRSDDSVPLSLPMTGHMSRFALLCQAARLLGQVLRNVSNDSVQDDSWIQLDRTLHSMLAASLEVDLPDYDQITFIYSALVALYTPWLYSGSSKPETERSQRAKIVIQQITERIRSNLVEGQCFFGRNPENMSPWGLFFTYHICGAHMRFGDSSTNAVIENIRDTFSKMDARWNAAGIYLQLLEAREVNNIF